MSLETNIIRKLQSRNHPNRTILEVELSHTNGAPVTGPEMEKFMRQMRFGPLKARLLHGAVQFDPDIDWRWLADYECMLFAHRPEMDPIKVRFDYSYKTKHNF
jgi:hypothetical protein